ncbi:hypothetical protein MUK42_14955 [Musa troglodytarum]|uniref:Uncharacterized protein n=1 Tax=Musa troglodytarum TaxID=320322 RepID=A0A9E7LCJ5_9LILI|nr:hypothetical protein MUK42_14955 [Musa troglodytarum]
MASPRDSGAAQRPPAASSPPPFHAMDADEEDDNVKQLKECATLYLSLQECLAETNRNWKSCQSCTRWFFSFWFDLLIAVSKTIFTF